MKYNLSVLIIFFLSGFQLNSKPLKTFDVKVTTEELKLYDLLMVYRKSLNLPGIPLSKSLTYVAQEHCKDLSNNKPDLKKGCNAHSWSDKGKWSSCCYTSDGRQSKCMWDKPKELTNYESNGYEIACGSSDPIYKEFIMTPDYAIQTWEKSYFHNCVITNKDIWKDFKWNAIGIGIYKGFAVVWFGDSTDTEGEPSK